MTPDELRTHVAGFHGLRSGLVGTWSDDDVDAWHREDHAMFGDLRQPVQHSHDAEQVEIVTRPAKVRFLGTATLGADVEP